MIDLHTHTTASDGALSPRVLVERAHALGIRGLSVTDHDTLAGVREAFAAAAARCIPFLPGIEITAVDRGRDVHVLGYFFESEPAGLTSFLADAQQDRARRAREMSARLAAYGVPVDIEDLIAGAQAMGRSVARPAVARALLDAGHVASLQEAFDRWLGEGRPAYVPRRGASPAQVIRLVRRAGGLPVLAHPGLLGRDELIPELAAEGLGGVEAYHSDHDARAQARYLRIAARYGLVVSGGSDYHGDDHPRAGCFGRVGLPRDRFGLLLEQVQEAYTAVHGSPSRSEPSP